MESEGIQKVEIVMKRTNLSLSLPDFKTYYRATVIKSMWYWNEDEPETNETACI